MFSYRINPSEKEYPICFSVPALVFELSADYKHPVFWKKLFFNIFADNYAALDSYFS